jgi:acyl dehydratase
VGHPAGRIAPAGGAGRQSGATLRILTETIMRRYLEDLKIGDIWTSRELLVTEEDLLDYARKYDPQPMHIDVAAAAKGPHGSIIASGGYVSAMSLKLFLEAGGYGETPVLGLGHDELRWHKAVKPGDRLVAQREIISLRRSQSKPLNGIVRTKITMTNQHGVLVMSVIANGMITARTDGSEQPTG